jgi:hypothetical protein
MTRRKRQDAVLRAFEEAEGPSSGGGEEDALIAAAANGLRRLGEGLPAARPPAALRERVLAAAVDGRARRWGAATWMAAAAAAAAVLVGLMVWAGSSRPGQQQPPERRQETHVPLGTVLTDAELDRRLAAAEDLAFQVQESFNEQPTWWDEQVQSIRQDIETLGQGVTDPTATRPAAPQTRANPVLEGALA